MLNTLQVNQLPSAKRLRRSFRSFSNASKSAFSRHPSWSMPSALNSSLSSLIDKVPDVSVAKT